MDAQNAPYERRPAGPPGPGSYGGHMGGGHMGGGQMGGGHMGGGVQTGMPMGGGGMGGGGMGGGGGGGGGGGMGASLSTSSLDLHAVASRARKLKKDAAPYLPTIVRLLLVATFIEDGVRVLFEMPHQIDFLKMQYRLPAFIGAFLLLVNVAVSFAGGVLVVAQKKIARGKFETHGSYCLLACVVYQQIVYGRHSPIGSGNLGFLVRNLCLAGSLILIACQVRLAAGQSALPMGLLDNHAPTKKQTVAYMQLGSRVLLVLLALEFVTTFGVYGTILTVPFILAVLFGYQLEISGSILLTFYFVHNILNSSFWSVRGSYMREIMRYEFVQTLSIMGGLILMITVGPGALSVDEMRGRKAW